MPDYVPRVSRDDVLRVIDRDYSAKDRQAILEMLDEYGTETWHGAPHRVHLAILKLGGGDKNRLRPYIDIAKCDFRDVVAPAEYPKSFDVGFAGVDRMSPQEVKQMQEDDWHQYQEWLNAT